jgi:LysR family transcriptional regulator for bpeEF and oprC
MPHHPNDIEKRHHLVGFFSGGTRRMYPHQFHKGDEVIELTGPYRVAVNEGNSHIDAVRAGFGISQCIRFAAEPYLARGELVEVLTDWDYPALPVHVVYPPNRHLSAKVRVFVDWAAELFAQNPKLQRA